MGKADAIVLDFARQEGRILLTRNCHDIVKAIANSEL
jgi:uncharacterized protein with PIN domain